MLSCRSITISLPLLFTLACKVDGADDTNGSDESGAAVVDCEAQLEQATCEAVDNAGEGCVWITLDRAVRTGDSCTLEATNLCVDDDVGDTAAGCFDVEGCQDGPYSNPFYKVEDGGSVLLRDQCGGTPPDGFAACPSGTADADPPECACACELAPG